MDPHQTVSSGLLSWGAGLAYSRLFKFDTTDGIATVVCDLCSSWEQSAPLTFSVKLRDDVVWQNLPPLNGRALTAQDVVFSLNRQKTSTFPNAALLSNISEFTAIGEHEILIRLKAPDSETLEKLADSHSRIVAPEAVEVNGDLRRGPTVGTGPWIASEVQADTTRLIVNPDYYGDEVPYLAGLDIQVTPSEATRVAGMRSRIIDLAQARFGAVASARERFEEIEWIGVENPAAGVEIMMNTARSPMDRQAVREAMMLTWPVGKRLVIPGSVEIPDSSNPNSGISLGLPILNPSWVLPVSKFSHLISSGQNGLDQANTLLTSAALKPSDNVVIKVGEFGQDYIDQANAMAAGLASVGIRADVERVSTRTFGDEVWIGGDYDIAVGAPPPVSSTTAYLFAVHHSAGPWNTTGYSDPEIDRLIEAQAREYDSVKRGEMLVEIQHLVLAGSHRFIVQTRTTHWIWWPFVHDFEPFTPRGDTEFLTRVWMTERGG
ncbi:MAG: ABC transporter substrate-binding protein [Dehalococcoidia bacterium]